MSVIDARDLSFEYKPKRGVRGINLSIDSGECFALLGRNGSGKSTLTRLVLGTEKAFEGNLAVLGQNLNKKSRNHLNKIGASLENDTHWEDLSGWENACFVARTYGMTIDSIQTRLKELFTLADIWDKALEPVKSYSYGMRRKLSHIQALCHDPELLILDEPTSGVDVYFLNRLGDIIKKRTEEGLCTWIACNDPVWISGLSTSLAFIDSGMIVYDGTEDELQHEISPFQRVSIHLSSNIAVSPPEYINLQSFNQAGHEITIILDKDPMHIPALLEWVIKKGGKISRIEVHQGTLTDAFLLKTGRKLEQ
jgi:ABC-type multidrug transport system ATPase subunit